MPLQTDNDIITGETAGGRALRSLRRWIEEGLFVPGGRVPSEEALSQRLGVARMTVRGALRQLESEGLVRVEGRGRVLTDKAGPVEVRGIMGDTIAILADPPSPDAPLRPQPGFSHHISLGAVEAIRGAELHALTLQPNRLDGARLRRLLHERPRGVIAFRYDGGSMARRDVLSAVVAAGVPAVVYGHDPSVDEFDTVSSDHESGEYQLTRFLIGRGCRRILRCWDSPDTPGRLAWVARRDAGYERAMREARLDVLPPLGFSRSPDYGIESLRHRFETTKRLLAGYLADHLLGPNPVDALMVLTDAQVLPVAAACRVLGKDPRRDVTIVGYDNYWSGAAEREWEPTVPAATVDKLNPKIGRALVDMILARGRGELPAGPQHALVEPELVVVEPAAGDRTA
ncbi:MAG TPA: GntR family transcriptional regulator [Tepidisphaeraceae bacterium]|jgi:DNA-binding LacI/PurR family transcriptional regulator|nr:GntR family transcriptional regulator [Tepidisphaeraceae bacterium]